MFSFIHTRKDVHSFQGLSPTVNTRDIPQMVPISYDEMAIGQRIQDALLRRLEMTGDWIAGSTAQVFYKSGILTIDCETPAHHHNRVVLGANDRATFMEYDLNDDGSRKMTVTTHLAASKEETDLESILAELKKFALEAQQPNIQSP